MKEPLVSVVMPSYNSEKHIAESIQSIVDQTFTDWEFIIVDGHSKDKTIEIINSFIEKDSRIKLLFDEGKGIGPALNLGCAVARGKYIARMDTDDVSLSGRLEEEIRYIESHPKVGVVSCCANLFDDKGQIIGHFFPYTWEFVIRRCATTILQPGEMKKKELYEKAGGYPPIKRAEDLMLWYKMLRLCHIKILNKVLVNYRVSNEALSNLTTEYFNNTVNSKWRIYAKGPLGSKELMEIENFVNDNIIKDGTNIDRVNTIEEKLFSFLKEIITEKHAVSVILLLKNIFGLKKL